MLLDTTLFNKNLKMTCGTSLVSPDTMVFSTNETDHHDTPEIFKTDRHDIAEILLKVALNTINQIKPSTQSYGFKQHVITPAP
jgi:hypothetical protein